MITRVLLFVLCLVGVSRGQQVIVVLLDDSGSMNNVMRSQSVRRIDAAKDALMTVLEQVPPEAQVGVMVLNNAEDDRHWILPLGPVEESSLQYAVQRIRASGGTPLGEFMKLAADELLARRATLGYGEYRLLIVTDGEANDADLVERHLPEILGRAITVDVIGVDMDQDHSLATKVDNYRRADDPASLTRAIRQSLAESSADGNDPDEQSDFAVLAGLPDEIAVAAIEALSELDNRPIGASAKDGVETEGFLTPRHRSYPPRHTSGPTEPTLGGWLGSMVVGIALILAVLFGCALKSMRH